MACLIGSAHADISYRNDVAPILSKVGCNAGTCHGNFNGKGGFKLSLRGENPTADYNALIRGEHARRVDAFQPAQSLILRKATAAVAHEGGKRFGSDSIHFKTIQKWISQGANDDGDSAPKLIALNVQPREVFLIEPSKSFQINVQAVFDDKTVRDVKALAVFDTSNFNAKVDASGLVTALVEEGETAVLVRFLSKQETVRVTVVPKRPAFTWSQPESQSFIDDHIFAKLKQLRMNPSPICSDSQFIRRLYLDLLGIVPTPAEAKAFAADTSADKRSKLIDSLLTRKEFADVWAMKWSDLLRNEEKIIDSKGVEAFHNWIRRSMADAKPLDQFVRELITAKGSTYKVPASNFYRALREPNLRAEATSQLFLGTRMQCAKCHNHPFDRWTQNDYYGFAAFFSHVEYKIVENKPRDKNDKMMFVGEQIVLHNGKAQVKHPNTGRVIQPAFLDAAKPDLKDRDKLDVLAEWLTSPKNPRFAKAMANRIWQHMLGRGIVDPIDDFRDTNPPSHPALLDALAEHLVVSKFDLRDMVRLIANSRTYQTSSTPNETNQSGATNFARVAIRRLSAEQMVDAISISLDAPVSFNGYDGKLRAGQLSGVNKVYRDGDPSPGDRFLKLFGKPGRLTNCECERTNETALGQVLELISGRLIDQSLTAKKNRLAALINDKNTSAQIVAELYWAVLSREPTKDEAKSGLYLIEAGEDRRAALEDFAWGLLNSKEFLFRN